MGYVSRPLGAVILGAYGDRHGRKKVLVFAMLLMGFATFAVGLLPTYGQVGLLAPVLLVILRLIQGFAVAGELGGASAMIVEHSPPTRSADSSRASACKARKWVPSCYRGTDSACRPAP